MIRWQDFMFVLCGWSLGCGIVAAAGHGDGGFWFGGCTAFLCAFLSGPSQAPSR
jgi:hypothetical protein